jgi:hypothetical protein
MRNPHQQIDTCLFLCVTFFPSVIYFRRFFLCTLVLEGDRTAARAIHSTEASYFINSPQAVVVVVVGSIVSGRGLAAPRSRTGKQRGRWGFITVFFQQQIQAYGFCRNWPNSKIHTAKAVHVEHEITHEEMLKL